MTETYNTNGIVLRYWPWREYDRLYVIYTEAAGKLIVRAHGVRRPRAKLAGALEPFAEVEFYLIRAKQFHKIGGAVVQQRFNNLRQSRERCAAAQFCCEIVDRLTREQLKDPALYQLLLYTLTQLNQQSTNRLLVYSFVVKLIKILGYDLANAITATNAQQPDDLIKLLRWLQQQPYSEIQKLRLNDELWKKFVTAVRTWLYEYLGDHVQSERFLVY